MKATAKSSLAAGCERGMRDKIVLCTKVGSDMGQGRRDLRASWIVLAVEDSLRRLQTDHIDLYQTHWPNPQTPEEETLRADDTLITEVKVRAARGWANT